MSVSLILVKPFVECVATSRNFIDVYGEGQRKTFNNSPRRSIPGMSRSHSYAASREYASEFATMSLPSVTVQCTVWSRGMVVVLSDSEV